nr:putative ribonuclease H-like domain-containing protein [Tanacetum cinerariifolium]
MESLSPQVVAAAKLPILNPKEFDLWKMRIEQYFLMTGYSLWEVILNGDSPIPIRIVDGVIQLVAPTTVEQRLARKNELKARGTLLMALPNKHQLKLNIHKDAKSLIEAIEKRFGRNKETKKVQKTLLKQQYKNFNGSSSKSIDQIHYRLQKLISQLEILDLENQNLDDVFNNLKIYEAEVKSLSYTSSTTQNIVFVSSHNTDSTNESVSDVTSVSAASTKVLVFALPNVDNLSDAEVDLKWKMAMLTMRGRRFLQRIGRNLGANETTSIGFDMSKVECYNCHKRRHFSRECSVMVLVAIIGAFREMKNQQTMPSWHSSPQVLPVLIMRKSQFDVLSYKTGLESVEARLVVYQQNENVFEEDIKLLKLDVMLRDNALVELRKKFKKVEQNRDELKLKLENFQTSLKNLSQLLASQITDKTGLGYDNQVFNSTVFHCDELFSFESDVSMHTSPVHDRYKSGEGYHDVPPSYTGTFMPHKPNLVFHDAHTACETVPTVLNVEPSPTKPNNNLSQSNRPSALIIEDWVFDSEDESEAVLTRYMLVLLTVARPITTIVSQTKVQQQRPTKHGVYKAYLPIRRPSHHRPSPKHSNFPPQLTVVKANQHALKDKGVIDSGCSRHMTGNISYLYEFKEINGGYVAFGGNSKGGKIIGKGKIKTAKLDFDIYFVKELKFHLFSVSQMCDKKNNVLFTDTECIILSSDFKLPDENHVLLRVPRENNMYNVDLKNIVSSRDLTFLFAKATLDESNLWHRRLGHIYFKIMNKLVKGNLVRGLPSKVFENNHTCVACKKGKQHRASWIKREFSVARTFQLNGIAKRNNRTLIEAARTMLADSLSPIPFWAKAVNISCYVQNRVLVTKPHNKTGYELLLGRTPSLEFMRPFGCLVTILNTLDPIGKFNGKADEGFLVGYSVSSKAFRVFNSRTKIVQETLHINFLENQPNVAGSGLAWLFDIDTLTQSMNYQQLLQGINLILVQVSKKILLQNTDADAFEVKEPESEFHVSSSSGDKTKKHDEQTTKEAKGKSPVELSIGVRDLSDDFEEFSDNSTNRVNAASTPVTTVGPNSTNSTNTFNAAGPSNTAVSLTFRLDEKSSFMDPSQYPDDPDMPAFEDISYSDNEVVGAEADFSNLETNIIVSPILITRVHKDHLVTQIIGDLSSAPQIRSMARMVKEQEPKRVHQALKDPSWIKAMQEKFLQFKMQKEEGIDYEDVFAPVARIEAMRLFLAYASLMGFMVYQMDVKSSFLYGTIEEEVYVCQPSGFEDPDYLDKRGKIDQTLFIKKHKGDILLVQVYVDDIIFGSTNKKLCKAFEKLTKDKFQMISMRELTFFLRLQVKPKQDGVFISQDKYVTKILRKFGLTDGKSASTPINTKNPLLKNPDGEDVDVHTYRSMIGSLMYLTSSRLDLMFVVCACAYF